MVKNGECTQAKGPKYVYRGSEIRLDKEGRWFHQGVEITHQRTIALFNRSIKRDEKGYRLEIGREYAPIEVEDTAFFVKRVDLEADCAVIRLSDGSEEELDPETLWVGAANVLYCQVKDGELPARFLRPAYYQLMRNLEETDHGFAVRIGKKRWPLRRKDNNS